MVNPKVQYRVYRLYLALGAFSLYLKKCGHGGRTRARAQINEYNKNVERTAPNWNVNFDVKIQILRDS
jgi:hypothetical protein